MPLVTIDGQPLHFIDQGTGPAVLLAGSYLWDQAMWAPQIAALSQQYRVIALDLWGHGESGPLPEGTQSLDDIARQALALLDHLDIDRVTLVGLSVGGMWGVRLALSVPQRINGLVLMDTYVGVEPEPTRQYYFSLFKQIEDTGVIAPQLLDIVVPIFFRPGIDAQHQFENTVHRTCHGLLITLLLREIIRADDADDIPRHRVLHELQAHLQILPAVLTSFIPAHKAYTFPSLGIVCQQPFPMIADGIRRFFLRITNPLTHLVKELCHGQPLLCIVQYNAALLNRQDGIVRYIHLVGIQARGGQQPLILLEIPKGGLKILLLRNIDSRTNRLQRFPQRIENRTINDLFPLGCFRVWRPYFRLKRHRLQTVLELFMDLEVIRPVFRQQNIRIQPGLRIVLHIFGDSKLPLGGLTLNRTIMSQIIFPITQPRRRNDRIIGFLELLQLLAAPDLLCHIKLNAAADIRFERIAFDMDIARKLRIIYPPHGFFPIRSRPTHQMQQRSRRIGKRRQKLMSGNLLRCLLQQLAAEHLDLFYARIPAEFAQSG